MAQGHDWSGVDLTPKKGGHDWSGIDLTPRRMPAGERKGREREREKIAEQKERERLAKTDAEPSLKEKASSAVRSATSALNDAVLSIPEFFGRGLQAADSAVTGETPTAGDGPGWKDVRYDRATPDQVAGLVVRGGETPPPGQPAQRPTVTPATSTWMRSAGDFLVALAQEGKEDVARPDPRVEQSFLWGTLPSGFGSMGGFMLAGGAAGTAGLVMASAATEATTLYSETAALLAPKVASGEMTRDEAQTRAWAAFGAGIGLGLTDAWEVGNLLKRIDQVSGGGGKRLMRAVAANALGELAQESVQTIGEEATLAVLGEDERSLLDRLANVAEAGAAGGIIGASITLMLGSAKMAAQRAYDRRMEREGPQGPQAPKQDPAAPQGEASLEAIAEERGEVSVQVPAENMLGLEPQEVQGRLVELTETGARIVPLEGEDTEGRWVPREWVSARGTAQAAQEPAGAPQAAEADATPEAAQEAAAAPTEPAAPAIARVLVGAGFEAAKAAAIAQGAKVIGPDAAGMAGKAGVRVVEIADPEGKALPREGFYDAASKTVVVDKSLPPGERGRQVLFHEALHYARDVAPEQWASTRDALEKDYPTLMAAWRVHQEQKRAAAGVPIGNLDLGREESVSQAAEEVVAFASWAMSEPARAADLLRGAKAHAQRGSFMRTVIEWIGRAAERLGIRWRPVVQQLKDLANEIAQTNFERAAPDVALDVATRLTGLVDEVSRVSAQQRSVAVAREAKARKATEAAQAPAPAPAAEPAPAPAVEPDWAAKAEAGRAAIDRWRAQQYVGRPIPVNESATPAQRKRARQRANRLMSQAAEMRARGEVAAAEQAEERALTMANLAPEDMRRISGELRARRSGAQGQLRVPREPGATGPRAAQSRRTERRAGDPAVEAEDQGDRFSVPDSPAFRRWFGDSKVVDEDGKPLVVYHGTPAPGFTEFDPGRAGARFPRLSRRGSYFVRQPTSANAFNTVDDGVDSIDNGFGGLTLGGTYPVYLSIKNPLVVDRVRPEVVERAQREGYDGVIGTGGVDGVGGGAEYVAFDPRQIKSAIGNRGTFDASNPDIRFSTPGSREIDYSRWAAGQDLFSVPEDRSGEPWFSAVERAIEALPQEKMSKGQAIAALRKAPGVTQEELEWVKVGEVLEGAGSVTKAELLAWVKAHRVIVDEVTYSKNQGDTSFEIGDFYLADSSALEDVDVRRVDEDEAAMMDITEGDWVVTDGNGGALPEGWEGYLSGESDDAGDIAVFETLTDAREAAAEVRQQAREWFDDMEVMEPRYDRDSLVLPGGKDYTEVLLRWVTGRTRERAYIGSHWEESDVLAHIRFKERATPEGERVMFLEEVQSDWHQAGRKGGYGNRPIEDVPLPDMVEAVEMADGWQVVSRDPDYDEAEVIGRYIQGVMDMTPDGDPVWTLTQNHETKQEALREYWIKRGANPVPAGFRDVTEADLPEGARLVSRQAGGGQLEYRVEFPNMNAHPRMGTALWVYTPEDALVRYFRMVAGVEGRVIGGTESRVAQVRDGGYTLRGAVPDGPFKTSWPTLALKRAIKWAADHGFDRLAWTPGVEQVKRYSSMARGVVDRVVWRPGELTDGVRIVSLTKENSLNATMTVSEAGVIDAADGYGRDTSGWVGSPLSDVLGDQMAARILAEPQGEIAGEEIVVGGKGMTDFYDRMLGNAANKLGKKYGARVGTVDVSVTRTEDTKLAESRLSRALDTSRWLAELDHGIAAPSGAWAMRYASATIPGAADDPVATMRRVDYMSDQQARLGVKLAAELQEIPRRLASVRNELVAVRDNVDALNSYRNVAAIPRGSTAQRLFPTMSPEERAQQARMLIDELAVNVEADLERILAMVQQPVGMTVQALPITEAMREAVQAQGFSTFADKFSVPGGEGLARNLYDMHRFQSRYLGNKREALKKLADVIASVAAADWNDVETVFDLYAGGGTYGMSYVRSGAVPNAKRVVINEIDPVRREKFELARKEGGDFITEWEASKALRDWRAELQPLMGRSATPAQTRIVKEMDEGTARWRALNMRQKAAVQAVLDVMSGGYTKSWEHLVLTAQDDAQNIKRMADSLTQRGVRVETVSMNAYGPEAVALVKGAGRSLVIADPPYRGTSQGTYTATDGSRVDLGSEEELRRNLAGLASMAQGNAVIYHNSAHADVVAQAPAALPNPILTKRWNRTKKAATAEFLVISDTQSQRPTRRTPARDLPPAPAPERPAPPVATEEPPERPAQPEQAPPPAEPPRPPSFFGGGSTRPPGPPVRPRPTPTPEPPRQESFLPTAPSRLDLLNRAILQEFEAVDRVQADVERARRAVTEAQDAALAIKLAPGRVRAAMAGGRRLENLLLRYVRQHKLDLERLGDYLRALGAPMRNAVAAERNPASFDLENLPGSGTDSQGNPLTNSRAAQIVAEVEAGPSGKHYKHAASIVHSANDAALNLSVYMGLRTAEHAEELRSRFGPYYVPMRSEEIPGGDYVPFLSPSGFQMPATLFHRAEGRTTLSGDPVAWTFTQFDEIATRGTKNEVPIALAELIRAHPNDRLWGVRGEETEEEKARRAKAGITREDVLRAEDAVELRYYDKGEPKYLILKGEIGRDLSNSLKRMSAPQAGVVVRLLGSISRAFVALATRYSPNFLVGNAPKDIQAAALRAGAVIDSKAAARIIKDTPGYMLAGLRVLRAERRGEVGPTDAKAEMFRRWRDAGGQTSWYHLDRYEKRVHAYTKAQQRGNLVEAATFMLGAYEDLQDAAEMGTRVGSFAAAVQAGLSDAKAAAFSRDVTVDFNRRGELASTLNGLYWFFNASAQGSRMVLKTIATPRGAALAGAMVGLGYILAWYNRVMGEEDDHNRWDESSAWSKKAYANVLLPEEYVVRLPVVGSEVHIDRLTMPIGWGWNVFYAAGVALEEVHHGNGDVAEAVASIASSAIDAFSPLGSTPTLTQAIMPSLVDPIVQVAENVSWSGSAVHPESYGSKAKSWTAWPDTPELYKEVAQRLNALAGGTSRRTSPLDISPASIDYLVRQYSSGLGSFFAQVGRTGRSLATGSEVEASDIPMLRRFVGGPNDRAVHGMVSRAIRDIEASEGEVRDGQETEHPGLVGMGRLARAYKKRISEMRDEGDKQGALAIAREFLALYKEAKGQ